MQGLVIWHIFLCSLWGFKVSLRELFDFFKRSFDFTESRMGHGEEIDQKVSQGQNDQTLSKGVVQGRVCWGVYENVQMVGLG